LLLLLLRGWRRDTSTGVFDAPKGIFVEPPRRRVVHGHGVDRRIRFGWGRRRQLDINFHAVASREGAKEGALCVQQQ